MAGIAVSDIKLAGDIQVTGTGDIALVSNIDNLKQRIINKFKTNKDYYLFGDFGSVTKNLVDYTGGDLIDKIKQSVTATLITEPNIASVDEVNVTQDGDTFYIDISITDVTNTALSFTTTL
jgi:hypothetical protein